MPRPYNPRNVPPISLRKLSLQAVRKVCQTTPDVVQAEAKGVEVERYIWPNGTMVLVYASSSAVAGLDRQRMKATVSAIEAAITSSSPSMQ